MSRSRRVKIHRHLSEDELDEQIRSANDPEMVQRLCFVKNLYHGDTLGEAADRVGRSQPTGVRWAERWNSEGIASLAPNYGGGRPPKLDEEERETLKSLLEADGPRTTGEVHQLIEERFDVTYHPNYVPQLLGRLGVDIADGRSERLERRERDGEHIE